MVGERGFEARGHRAFGQRAFEREHDRALALELEHVAEGGAQVVDERRLAGHVQRGRGLVDPGAQLEQGGARLGGYPSNRASTSGDANGGTTRAYQGTGRSMRVAWSNPNRRRNGPRSSVDVATKPSRS